MPAKPIHEEKHTQRISAKRRGWKERRNLGLVWRVMGAWGRTRSPRTPSSISLILLTLAGIIVKSVNGSLDRSSSCRVHSCWDQFEIAEEAMAAYPLHGTHRISPSELKCIPLRTYVTCVEKVSRGCSGDIYYYTVRKTVNNRLVDNNCSRQGTVYDPKIHGIPVHPLPKPDSPCGYNGPPVYRHCGLFGDPHLKTFNNEFQTCKVRGAWPLVNNKHLTVQVTNDPVGNDGTATATSKLTVVIKRNDECAANRYITFQAQSDILPGTFDGGRTHFGRDKAVQLIEKEPGKHIEIYIRYIDTIVIVRRIGRFFTFSINVPEQILNETRLPYSQSSKLQLCVDGCPAQERSDYQAFLSKKISKLKSELKENTQEMSHEAAIALCRDADVVDFYFDSCVFDLLTTGDTNFTVAANTAYKDVLRLDPDVERILEKRQNLSHLQNMSSRTRGSWESLIFVALCLCLNHTALFQYIHCL